ncbi:hypothetical protein PMAYCL1PPCAC_00568, partial [Pristionchus mayeri]
GSTEEGVATVVPLDEEADRYLPLFISNLIVFYLSMCESFMNRTEPNSSHLEEMVQAMDEYINEDSEEDRNLFFEQLVRHIDRQTILYCSFCHRCMFTARHIFMHIASTDHGEQFGVDCRRVNTFLTKMVGENRV